MQGPERLKYSTNAMGRMPLSTIIIAVAMLAFSVLIVSKIGGKIHLSGRVKRCLLVFGIAAFTAGIYLHLQEAEAPVSAPVKTSEARKVPKASFAFTFEPRQAKWGDRIEIQVPFPADTVTVYLNGTPLPKRLSDDRHAIRVIVPSGSKTGYLELERDGERVRGTSQITINP